ncbi:Post-GPI attachment to proteins factor 2 [Homalodisca vitripennis]|nr:Post-GPI attachment to proteins factor 2 [Homalodisca vitripennis]
MPSKPVMVNTTGYLPLNYRQSKGFVVRIPFEKLAWSTCLLPLSSFVFCVIWSLLYNFDDSTFTHCKVPNFLPSISAAIGNYRTQRFVWGTAIAVHAGPRFLFTSMYRQYYKDILNNGAQKLASVACFLNVVENVALIGLTFIPSAYNYGESPIIKQELSYRKPLPILRQRSKTNGLVDNVIASPPVQLVLPPIEGAAEARADVNERKTSLEVVPISKISNSRGADQKYKLNCNGKAIMYRAKNVNNHVIAVRP